MNVDCSHSPYLLPFSSLSYLISRKGSSSLHRAVFTGLCTTMHQHKDTVRLPSIAGKKSGPEKRKLQQLKTEALASDK